MTSTPADLLPALGLRVTAGPLELRGLTDDDLAGLAVSRKVGYRPAGQRRLERRPGEPAVNQHLVLGPADLVRGEPVTVEGLEAFRRSIGLDQEDAA